MMNVRKSLLGHKKRKPYRHESRDFLSIFNQLNTDTFTNGRVGLFGFNANFFEDNTLGMRRTSCRRCFVDVTESTFFVSFIGL